MTTTEHPTRRRDPLACTPAPPPQTQAERTARRVAFRCLVQVAPTSRDYQPRRDRP